jgi:hypothetical protein
MRNPTKRQIEILEVLGEQALSTGDVCIRLRDTTGEVQDPNCVYGILEQMQRNGRVTSVKRGLGTRAVRVWKATAGVQRVGGVA